MSLNDFLSMVLGQLIGGIIVLGLSYYAHKWLYERERKQYGQNNQNNSKTR
ncbi:hypothetical protein D3C73_1556220 [compost metagenome]